MTLLTLGPDAGTQPDIVSRLRAVLPNGWFADTPPILSGLLNGLGAAWAGLVGFLSYVQEQTRISTATDSFLDFIASDFFGTALVRAPGEPDASLRTRIERNLLAPLATRTAIGAILLDLTGRDAGIFEPLRITDTGAYGVASTLAYTEAGGYGSRNVPFQCFITAYRPVGAGVASTNGYGETAGGYGVGLAQYTTPTMAASTILDADILQAIAQAMPAASTAWTAISN